MIVKIPDYDLPVVCQTRQPEKFFWWPWPSINNANRLLFLTVGTEKLTTSFSPFVLSKQGDASAGYGEIMDLVLGLFLGNRDNSLAIIAYEGFGPSFLGLMLYSAGHGNVGIDQSGLSVVMDCRGHSSYSSQTKKEDLNTKNLPRVSL